MIPKNILNHLYFKIVSFLESFSSRFPNKMIPKMHFMLHYPRLISEFGPLQSLWCMRFEAKHQYFKRIAGGLNNYKNICRTLAERHQMKQCWEYSSLDVFHQQEEHEGLSSVYLNSLPVSVQRALRNFFTHLEWIIVGSDEVFHKVSMLRLDCVTYKVQDYFVFTTVLEDLPVFYKIVRVIKVRSTWLLCAKLCFPKCFSVHFWAYQISESDDIVVLKPGMEADYHALDSYMLDDGNEYIALHRRVWKCDSDTVDD